MILVLILTFKKKHFSFLHNFFFFWLTWEFLSTFDYGTICTFPDLRLQCMMKEFALIWVIPHNVYLLIIGANLYFLFAGNKMS